MVCVDVAVAVAVAEADMLLDTVGVDVDTAEPEGERVVAGDADVLAEAEGLVV
jgi:hypothetical protein